MEQVGDRGAVRVLEVVALQVGVEHQLPVRRLDEAALVRARGAAVVAEGVEVERERAEVALPVERLDRRRHDPDEPATLGHRQFDQ